MSWSAAVIPASPGEVPSHAAPATDALAVRTSAPELPASALVMGGSQPMVEAISIARRVASLPVDVLLVGETGSGKDTLADYVHHVSGRRGPFVAINCAGIPETLFESELFGTEAGAYTGAAKSRPGLLEHANGGTLYLDEIESMPLASQGKLLRVLQDRRVQRLGATHCVESRFRVIAATKKPLPGCIEDGTFRQDLFYRLSVVEIVVPALRERVGDIVPLFEHFAACAAKLFGMQPFELTPHLTQRLLSYDWPGNVRELKSLAQRAVLGLPLFEDLAHATGHFATLRDRLECYERHLIRGALEQAEGSVPKAAKALMTPIPTLYYRMRKLDILPAEYRAVPNPPVCEITAPGQAQ